MVAILIGLLCIFLLLGLIWVGDNVEGTAGIVAHIIVRVIGWLVLITVFAVAAVAVYLAINGNI